MQREVLPALVILSLPRVTAMSTNPVVNNTMLGRDLYLRLTDPTGKYEPVINCHRVYDREKFYAAQVKFYETPKNEDDKRLVTIATEAEFRASRKVKS